MYNIGGGRFSNCSMLEVRDFCQRILNEKLHWTYTEQKRIGDHIWWIGDLGKFMQHYPEWRVEYNVHTILQVILDLNFERWNSKR